MITLVLTAALAFAFGFVLGDWRGVKQANQILDANMRDLFKAIGDDKPGPVENEEVEPRRPTIH